MLDPKKNMDYNLYLKAIAESKNDLAKSLPSGFSSLFMSTFFTDLYGCVPLLSCDAVPAPLL